jgi:hypothetical protein
MATWEKANVAAQSYPHDSQGEQKKKKQKEKDYDYGYYDILTP